MKSPQSKLLTGNVQNNDIKLENIDIKLENNVRDQ